MEDFNAKAEIKQSRNKLVCYLKIKNNIVYDIDFDAKDEKTKKQAIKLIKNKVLKDAEDMESKNRKLSLFIKAAKEAIKVYKRKHKDPLLDIIDTIKKYDRGFPPRRAEDEYESCSHVH